MSASHVNSTLHALQQGSECRRVEMQVKKTNDVVQVKRATHHNELLNEDAESWSPTVPVLHKGAEVVVHLENHPVEHAQQC